MLTARIRIDDDAACRHGARSFGFQYFHAARTCFVFGLRLDGARFVVRIERAHHADDDGDNGCGANAQHGGNEVFGFELEGLRCRFSGYRHSLFPFLFNRFPWDERLFPYRPSETGCLRVSDGL
jgi:hypothetical protein